MQQFDHIGFLKAHWKSTSPFRRLAWNLYLAMSAAQWREDGCSDEKIMNCLGPDVGLTSAQLCNGVGAQS